MTKKFSFYILLIHVGNTQTIRLYLKIETNCSLGHLKKPLPQTVFQLKINQFVIWSISSKKDFAFGWILDFLCPAKVLPALMHVRV